MNYLQKNNSISRKRQGWKIPLGSTLLLLVVVFVIATLFPWFFPRTFSLLAKPFWGAGYGALSSVSEGVTYFQSKQSLEEENSRLKTQLESSRVRTLLFESVLKDNMTLRGLLGKEESQGVSTVGYILARPPVSPYDTLIIDVGVENGVENGDVALAFDSILLGEVIEVGQKTSKVRLYSYPDVEIEVYLPSSTTTATAIGKGGENFEITLPRDVEVSLSDTIVRAGADHLLMGTVARIERNDSDSFQRIFFRLPLNLRDIRLVELE